MIDLIEILLFHESYCTSEARLIVNHNIKHEDSMEMQLDGHQHCR